MNKIGIVIFFSLLLGACSTPPPPDYDPNHTQASLAEASFSVSRSIVDLAETAQAAHPLPRLSSPPSPASYGMGGLTSVDWSGPVEPLIKQIAKAANYRVRVLGRNPAIPVMVSIYTKDSMLGDILRDVGYQCGNRASVIIFPGSRVIEIRYAKT